MKPVKVGLVGCGQISRAYLENLTGRLSGVVNVVACCDLIAERAQERAAKFGIPRVCSTEELLADPEIELVVNLTMPAQHHEITMAAFAAGKHVFCEKPLSMNCQLGQEMVAAAAQRGVTLAGAADTFLGAALQATRKVIDSGAIGTPVSAQAVMAGNHSSQRYYDVFTGPMFDMGPYYLTAMLSLLGPVARVTGSAQTPFAEKPYPADSPDHGKTWKPSRPGNITGVLDFANGGVGVITTTSETPAGVCRLEVFGSEATLICNDPNSYTGSLVLQREDESREEIALPEGFPAWGRGLGVAEQARAIRAGRAPRASGNLMYHVLEIMHGIHTASQQGKHVVMERGVPRPEAFMYEELVG